MRTKFPAMTVVYAPEHVDEIVESVREILSSGMLIYGKYTDAFEQQMAKLCGKNYCRSVDHDTSGFEICMRILGVAGKKVIMPVNSFASIVLSIRRAGGIPVFIDMAPDVAAFGMGPRWEDIEPEIDGNVAAVVVVHNAGYVATDVERIVRECHKRGVFVFEDAAHTFGSTMNGKHAGSFGDVSVFSGYATKVISFGGEGGCIVCDDKEFWEEIHVYRNYGREGMFGKSVFLKEGYNWAPTEIQNAIGLVQLNHLDEIMGARQKVVDGYDLLIDEGWEGVQRLPQPPNGSVNGYRYILLAEFEELRDEIVAGLRVHGISCPGLVYDIPLHKQPIFKGYKDLKFPVAEQFCKTHFALPIYTDMTEGETAYVVEQLCDVMNDTGRKRIR